MAIVTISSSKGGAGKTTTARLLALSYAQHYRVGCLDADRNPAFHRWLDRHQTPNITAVKETDESNMIDVIADLHEQNDVVIIDTAGAETQASLLAMSAADLVLIPSQLSHDDLVETVKTFSWARSAAEKAKHTVTVRVLLTRVKQGTKISDLVLKVLQQNNLPALPIYIRDLVAFGEMSHIGGLPIGTEAKKDLDAFMREVGHFIDPILADERAEKITGELQTLEQRHA